MRAGRCVSRGRRPRSPTPGSRAEAAAPSSFSGNASPAEEPIWVVPFLRLVEIEPVLPATLGPDGNMKSVQDRRARLNPHVGQQPRHEERGAAKSPLDVRPIAILAE